MTNKELMQKLQKYFLEKCDPETVAKLLASNMIDMHRIWNIDGLPKEERECLIARMRHNAKQLNKFVDDESPEGITLVMTDSAEEVRRAR